MKNNKIYSFALAIIIIVVVGVLLYNSKGKSGSDNYQPSETKKAPDKLKVVYLKDNSEDTGFLLNFTQDKGFYAKNNLEIERLEVMQKVDSTLMTGEADVTISGLTPYVMLYLNDAEPRVLANVFNEYTYIGLSRFPKENANSIKKVAVYAFGKEPHMRMIAALKNLGLDPDPARVDFTAAPAYQNQEAMLAKGELDFIIIPSNLSEFYLNKNYSLYKYDEMLPNSGLYRGIVTTKKDLEEKPEQLKNFVFSIYESLKYMSDNSEETITYIKNKYSLSDEEAKRRYNNFMQAAKKAKYVPGAQINNNILEFVKSEAKPTNPDRDLSGFFYSDFARQAAESIGDK